MGKAALATGGAKGIGRAVARRLAAEGWSVAVPGREAPGPGLDARFAPGDVAEEADVRRGVEVAPAAFGGLAAIVGDAGAEFLPDGGMTRKMIYA